MKKLLSLLCMAAFAVSAQPYGELLYPHPNALSSSGTNVTINTLGFLMADYVPSAAVGSPNFFIDKTGPGGVLTGTAAPFTRSYMVFGARTCASPTLQARNLSGVTAIEANTTAIGAWYALAGAYEEGCFFAALAPSGAVITKELYIFPGTALRPTKPIIIRAGVPRQYYMCGAFNNGSSYIMYINRVDENGNLLSSSLYLNSSRSFIPADMILSPYTPAGVQELIVVGEADDISGGTGSRGFAMRVNANALPTVLFYGEYGHAPTVAGKDAFGCIAVATSTSNGGDGFVIGGATDTSPNNGQVWALKVNRGCTGIFWNKILAPTTNIGARPMISILERLSPTFGFTYFGAVKSSNGMMGLKLDDNGNPFAGSPPVVNFNEFVYAGPITPPSSVVDMSFVNTGAPTDVGVQFYGHTPGTAGGRIHFVEAAFNGKSGSCPNSTITTGMLAVSGPTPIVSLPITATGGLHMCDNFMITTTPVSTPISTLCSSATLPAGGSNSRTTGIAEQNESSGFKVAPNPVTDKLEITFSASESDAVEIKLYDYTGRLIKVAPELNYSNGNATATIDMSRLSVESGVYIINTIINGERYTQKIIYTKGQ